MLILFTVLNWKKKVFSNSYFPPIDIKNNIRTASNSFLEVAHISGTSPIKLSIRDISATPVKKIGEKDKKKKNI